MSDTTNSSVRRLLRSWSGLPQMVCHQAGWWACVLWMGWQGPTVMGLFIAVHLYQTRSCWRRETKLMIWSTMIGLVLDNTLAATDSVIYTGELVIVYCPLWLAAIWTGFGATLRYSQRILVRTPYHALATGILGGPLAYIGGEKLERLTINGTLGLLAISMTWGVAMCLLYRLSRAQQGSSSQPSTDTKT